MYRVGGRMPLHSTGVGHVLLAHAPVDVQEEELAGDLTVAPENIQLTAADLRIRLAAVRRDGVAVVSRPQPEPMTSVASAIFSHDRTPVAAVSVITRATAEPLALAIRRRPCSPRLLRLQFVLLSGRFDLVISMV